MARPKKDSPNSKPKKNSCEESDIPIDKPKFKFTPGRPNSFKLEYCQLAIDMMAEGATITEFAAEVSVSRQTVYNWINDKNNKAFKEAIEIGLVKAQAWHEKWGRLILTGAVKGNAAMWFGTMYNRFKEDWKPEHLPMEEAKGSVKITVSYQKPQAKIDQDPNEDAD